VRVKFKFITHLTFKESIKAHYFKFLSLPLSNSYQKITLTTRILPSANYSEYIDGYGNCVLYGSIPFEHSYFSIELEGEAIVKERYYLEEPLDRRFLLPYLATLPSEMNFNAYLRAKMKLKGNDESVEEVVKKLMEWILSECEYEKYQTTTMTDVDQFLHQKRGVCQDFANLLILFLRYHGIAARYVAGLMLGEGETHAWVEVFDGKGWIGVDPTHNRFIESGYIKLSHGRDSRECMVNHGVFSGEGAHSLYVDVKVEQ